MATFVKFHAFIEAVAEKKHDLGADVLMIALTNTLPVQATAAVLTDITEIAYTNLSARTVTRTSSAQTGGVYKLVLADLVLTASGPVAPFRYAVLYNNTAAAKDLINFWDYGSVVTMGNLETFTVDMDPSAGVLTLA